MARDERFAPADLGPHEEPLRQMLIQGDPGPPDRFPLLATALTHEDALLHGLVMGPARATYEGMQIYTVIYGGFAWHIGVASHCPPEILQRALTQEGTMLIPVQPWWKHSHIRAAWRKHRERRRGWEQ